MGSILRVIRGFRLKLQQEFVVQTKFRELNSIVGCPCLRDSYSPPNSLVTNLYSPFALALGLGIDLIPETIIFSILDHTRSFTKQRGEPKRS